MQLEMVVRSLLGALILDKTELHLIMTSSHFVDDSLMDAVISNDDLSMNIIANIERYHTYL